MTKKISKMCHRWEHDFSYDGKKKHNEICCRNCKKNLIEWINDRKEEFDRKMYNG